jgi:L-ascorbate metabolism protein UlaG (beta-lactamase superfamily)
MNRVFWLLGMFTLCSAMAPTSAYAAENQLAGDRIPTEQGSLIVHPIMHATFVLQWNGKTIYVDPVGGAEAFAGLPKPDLVLITHSHGDHLDVATLQALLPAASQTPLVVPKIAAEKLPESLAGKAKILANGDKIELAGIGIEAVPAYNTTPERAKAHPKGQGNGYVLKMGGKTVYIAGDTEDTPEMRALQDINVAFLPMNLPYTMSINQAAAAVRQFKPKIVYPYHYRNKDGTKADLEAFKRLVGADSEVRIREWYPQ